MTIRNTITDLSRITEAMQLKGPIEYYLWEELTDGCYWDTIEQIASQLETASCSAGSWSGMIYTYDIKQKLSDPDWQEAIEQALEDYTDATGEAPTIDPYGSGFTLEGVVTFAVDWVAHELSSRLRSLVRVAVVEVYADTMDSHPDVIAFDTNWEAQDFLHDEVERRVEHSVSHSPYAVTDEEREAMLEQEYELVIIREETL